MSTRIRSLSYTTILREFVNFHAPPMSSSKSKNHKTSEFTLKHLSWIIMTIALCLIISGVWGYYYGRNLYNNKIETCTSTIKGIVTSNEKQTVTHSRKHGTSWTQYLYQISFSYNVNDNTFTGSQKLSYSPGENIDIHYDPENPKKSFISDLPENTYNNCLNLSILGGWVLLLGILIRLQHSHPLIAHNKMK